MNKSLVVCRECGALHLIKDAVEGELRPCKACGEVLDISDKLELIRKDVDVNEDKNNNILH